ncbi:hypothetical protein TNIN_126801 [Trichonephila inaurata madagascariensis]|uniref:Uncharacterized protein n=1 Tax=Trichonephila inaurata madagascariensis TaxID=2747483 RepID=A0A8X6YE41_9ARAC|nr:hypothetical protein TNIN_126801 [Trichonephila inaurata madagascariensis]
MKELKKITRDPSSRKLRSSEHHSFQFHVPLPLSLQHISSLSTKRSRGYRDHCPLGSILPSSDMTDSRDPLRLLSHFVCSAEVLFFFPFSCPVGKACVNMMFSDELDR